MGLNLGAFAAVGALQGIGQGMVHERNLQEAVDLHSQQMHEQEDYQEKLEKAKEADKESFLNAKRGQISGTDSDLMKMFDAQKNGNINNPNNNGGGTPPPANGAQPVPGMPQPPQAGQQTQGQGLDQPTGLPPVMAQGQGQISQQDLPPPQAQAPQAGQQPAPDGVTMTPMGAPPPQSAPPEIPTQSPAANIGVQQAMDSTKAMMQQGASPLEAAVANLPGATPALKTEMTQFAKANNITDVNQLEYLYRKKDEYLRTYGMEGVDKWQEHVVNPTIKDNIKNAPVDTSQWGSEDKATVAAMQREGVVGDSTQFKPLTPAQKKDNDTLVTQASNIKQAAIQGIGTFSRIIQNVSKINPGPGADTAAYMKNAWAQMTGSQRSEALTTFFEGQKDMVNGLNAQINTMRQMGGRFMVGAQVLKTEERGIPDITKMPPEASLALAQGYINNYKQMIGQADAIMNTPEEISPIKRIQFANKYSEKNPTFGSDGQTPNSGWQEFKDWRDSPNQDGMTGSIVRSQVDTNAAAALHDAKQGGKGEGAIPTFSNPQDAMKLKSGSKFYDDKGTLRIVH